MFYKKWISLTVCVLALLLLAGCGRNAKATGIEGVYELSRIEEQEMALPVSLTEENTVFLEICEGGTGVLHLRESKGNFRWSFSEGTVTIKAADWEATGTVDDGTLLLTFPSGANALFALSSDTDATEIDGSEIDLNDSGFPGNWYGWLKIDAEEGSFPKSWYDCCAKVTALEGNSFQIILWDEDGSLQDPLGEVTMNLQPDGNAVSENGYFCYANIMKNEWQLSRPDSFSPSALQISNCTHDAGGEVFSYSFTLHPWGTVWDSETNETAFLPFYYCDWYLPLIEEKAEMPDQIPWETLEELRASDDAGE